MNVVILNTAELTGGAAVAANRLMKALNRSGANVSMLVRDQKSRDPRVVSINNSNLREKFNFMRFVWERLVIFLSNHLRRKPLFQVSIANTGSDLSSHPLVQNADVIHLHWINQGFLSLDDIKKLIRIGKPVVWTMHDMWPCTAICHYSFGCERFKKECGKCPFLSSSDKKDLSYHVFNKKRFLADSKIQLVAVSTWLRQQAQDSALTNRLPVEVIPNVIDRSLFVLSDKAEARKSLSLPLDKKIILMGAARINDPIKGFEYLVKALSILKERKGEEDYFLVLFGGIKGDDSFLSEIPISYVWMGSLSDPSMIAKLYAAAGYRSGRHYAGDLERYIGSAGHSVERRLCSLRSYGKRRLSEKVCYRSSDRWSGRKRTDCKLLCLPCRHQAGRGHIPDSRRSCAGRYSNCGNSAGGTGHCLCRR